MLMENKSIPSNIRCALITVDSMGYIWKKRNGFMYAGNQGDPYIILGYALEEADHWLKLNEDTSMSFSQSTRRS